MKTKQKDKIISPTHQKIVELLNEHGYNRFTGGIQLFINQFDTEYSISVNFTATGLRINEKEVNSADLFDDELIKICKIWDYKS